MIPVFSPVDDQVWWARLAGALGHWLRGGAGRRKSVAPGPAGAQAEDLVRVQTAKKTQKKSWSQTHTYPT
jgi:hypothetical protein